MTVASSGSSESSTKSPSAVLLRIAHVAYRYRHPELKWTPILGPVDRLAGLQDKPRPGSKPTYTAQSGRRILAQLDEAPADRLRAVDGAAAE
jgi:hypothetical protein